MLNSTFWDTFKSLLQSTYNCATGCSCIDDRYEITYARVSSWRASAESQDLDILVSGFSRLQGAKFSSIDLDQLEEMTNLPFKNEKDAADWLGVWQYLLTHENFDHHLDKRNAWLDAGTQNFELTSPVEKEELIDLSIPLNGQLDWLTKDHQWQSLAQTPLHSKVPSHLFYRFIAEPGIFETELEEQSMERCAPALMDIRLMECNSLTDDCIRSLTNFQGLRVLSLGSLQLKGETLQVLSQLKNLKKLDLVGCKNISSSAIDQLQAQRQDLQILSSV